jgi:putative membrane protein
MKILFRIIAVLLFIVFFGFALKNTQEAALHLFLDYEIRGPLVLLLLGFFASGAVLGVLAMTPTVFRHRRDLNRHKRSAAAAQQEAEAQRAARANPPQPDNIG